MPIFFRKYWIWFVWIVLIRFILISIRQLMFRNICNGDLGPAWGFLCRRGCTFQRYPNRHYCLRLQLSLIILSQYFRCFWHGVGPRSIILWIRIIRPPCVDFRILLWRITTTHLVFFYGIFWLISLIIMIARIISFNFPIAHISVYKSIKAGLRPFQLHPRNKRTQSKYSRL